MTRCFGGKLQPASAYPQYTDYVEYPDYGGDDLEEEPEEGADKVYIPPVFTIEPQTIVAKEGEVAKIPCTAKNPNASVLIISKETTQSTLIYAGQFKVQHREKRYKLNGDSLEISQLKRTDSGTYLCKFSEQPPVQLNHTLDVLFAPSVKAKTGQQQRIVKGSSVTLECEAKGNPEPTITWSKLDGRLPSGAEKEEGLSITLENVDRHVEGNYECKASNTIGEPASQTFSVSIEYPPEIITEKESIRTGEGDQVELVCLVHARPSAEVTWSKDDQPLTFDPEGHIVEEQGGHRHTVKITKVTEADFGKYVCHAHNDMGDSTASIYMTGLPKHPVFTSDPNGGEEDAYTLTWDTESFYPITAYRIKYRKAQGNDTSSAESEDFNEITKDLDGEENESTIHTTGIKHSIRHTISDLESATEYEVKIEVKNKFAWSSVADFSFSTKKAEPTTTSTTTTSTTTTSAPILEVTGTENPATTDGEALKTGGSATTCASTTLVALGSLVALHIAFRT
ncbi:limbic system-associated membrane protein-like isoform X2 [Oratosquilla oratoria]|uniref:limbic system-associated membrane protein-like isoform X2 n=1 Tax=Oratosquilla oratoria TaxID=337810 RepID=UPI003F76F5F7